MENWITVTTAALLWTATMIPYLVLLRKKEKKAREKLSKTAGTELNVPPILHPKIDLNACIGCASCVKVCPEGVLGLIGGKATLIHAAKCVGHGLCAEHCPVGAIELKMGAPSRNAQLPVMDDDLQTNVPGIYIVGELGGVGLIRNAVNQGIRALDHIASNLKKAVEAQYDVIVVGAGPGGLASALTAKKHKLNFLLLEQGDIGGTILQYPRRKIVMTSPVNLPVYGKVKLTETSKENLLDVWNNIIQKTGLEVKTNEKVTGVQSKDGFFEVSTANGVYTSSYVVLALGRRGTPRKLGVPGEEASKVTYRLIEAESYKDCKLLVVGGGDSAVEAAVALACQKGNTVTLSYRKAEFSRIKDRNSKNLEDLTKRNELHLMLNSEVREIRDHSVLIEDPQGVHEIENDYVFVFAGGELPFDFLKKMGIEMQPHAV